VHRHSPASLAGCIVFILLAFWQKQPAQDFLRAALSQSNARIQQAISDINQQIHQDIHGGQN
jgi:hypothetical protein